MKLRRKSRYAAEVYTGSLNDIMFFLMLFFLIVSTIANTSAIKLMLPQAKSSQTMAKQSIVLSVNADKQYFLNDKLVASDQLEPLILNTTRGLTDPTIILRVANSLTIQELVDVMDIGARNKIRMILATTQKN